jgi:hypothetical protein
MDIPNIHLSIHPGGGRRRRRRGYTLPRGNAAEEPKSCNTEDCKIRNR